MSDEILTLKQKAFCEHYVACLNATKAAILAGYSEKTARQLASETLSKPYVRAYIKQLLEEKTLQREEILARLSEQARFDIGDILDKQGNIDFDLARENGLTHLIKSTKRRVTRDEKKQTETEYTEYELYDAQAALVHLGRVYSLFTDKTQQITDEWRTQAIVDIKNGLIDFASLSQAFDIQTARELFTLAGKAHELPA